MPLKELRGLFPALTATQDTITSPIDPNYNCHAWAARITDTWYEPYGMILPSSFPPYVWPSDLPHDLSPETFAAFYSKFGFELTDHSEMEDGFEKIAFYVRKGEVQHTARQLANGRWTSKIGDKEDIQHSLEELTTDRPFGYGSALIFMRRALT